MSGKSASKITIIVLLISLVPWFALSFYAHPQFDDYFLAILHNERGLWEHLQLTYINWSGRYFATLVPALFFHGEFNLKFYQIYPLLWLGLNFLLIYAFVNRHWIKGWTGLSITLVIFFLQLSMLPSPASSIYWLTGALAYFLPWLFTLAFWNQVLWKAPATLHGKIAWHALNLFLLAAIAGSNELSLYVMFCTMVAYIFIYNRAKQRIPRYFFYYFGFYLLAAAVMVAAPGNYHRIDLLPDSLRFGLSATQAIKTSIYTIWIYLRNPLFWAGIILLLYLMIKNKPSLPILDNYFRTTSIWVSLALSAVFIYGFYMLSWLILGSLVIDRQHNILALALWPVILIHIYGFIHRKDAFGLKIPDPQKLQLPLLLILVWFTFSDFYFRPGERPLKFQNSTLQVWNDWISGDASKFSYQHNTYYQLIREHREQTDTLLLPALEKKPITLFIKELNTNPEDFYNIYFAKYWQINHVKTYHAEECDDF
jgi:hypothetical protein